MSMITTKCNDVYFYGRGADKAPHLTAKALEEICIGRKRNGNYEIADLASLIFDLKDRIEKLEKQAEYIPRT